ncbi:MAG: extracellular solute-binding protein [Anaerolineae bacterium]|nr:extracellular solute-binding protein [Anaerolineae bacterium]
MLRLRPFLIILWVIVLTACSGAGDQPAADIPPNAIQISVIYSPESEQYMPEIMNRFNEAYRQGKNPMTGQPLAQGERPAYITGSPPQGGLSSGGATQGVVNAAIGANVENVLRPTLFAPSVSNWLVLANQQRPNLFDLSQAQATANSPVVIAIWESRLNAIMQKTGKSREEIGWQDLLDVLRSPNGWEDYGISGRKTVYYGHADPRNSSTALSALISEFYACARRDNYTGRRLELAWVRDPEVQQCVREIQLLVKHYARRTEDFLEYVALGPSYIDFLAMEEVDVICLNTGGRQGDEVCNKPSERLVALYPAEGTIMHEHPIAVVNADWVTAEQRQAAEVFIDFMLEPAQQELIMQYGFRPANPNVSLAYPFVEENGVLTSGIKTIIDTPTAETIASLQDSWSLVRKQADILLLIDVSGSMQSDGRLEQAKTAAEAFIESLEPTNRVGLYVFSDTIRELVPIDTLEINKSQLIPNIRSLRPNGGTELYKALRDTVNDLNAIEDADRIRAVVVLSDGEDTGSRGVTLQDALNSLNASRNTRNPVIVVPVAYGGDADIPTLQSIARASATRVVFGDPENILDVLRVLSAYF